MPGRQIRLPSSSETRQSLAFAILIRRVYPQRSMGDAFEGKRFRPGQTLPESDLWPAPDWPERPVLLEYAGSDRSGNGHRRSFQKYLLWLYDPGVPEWTEVARASAAGIEWVETLKFAALRCLDDGSPARVTSAADATQRVLGVLEAELEPLEVKARQALLGALWEQFLARMTRERVPEKAA